jgi:hypothetical protein
MKILRSPYSAIAAAVWLLAAGLIAMLAPDETRSSLLAGWAMAGLSGATSFGLLAFANGRPLKPFLSAVFGGFLARMALVALGFFWAIRHGYDPLWICVSFFGLYWVFFACEYLAMRQTLQHRTDPALEHQEALS